MPVRIEPSTDHPVPYYPKDDKPASFEDDLETQVETFDFLEDISALQGTPIELDANSSQQATRLLDRALKEKNAKALVTAEGCFAAREFLRQYSSRLAVEYADIRQALTNKLLELANCGDPKHELKAIELLGKHSDISLFTERSQVTIRHTTSDSLESAIKDRLQRLMSANIVDVTPMSSDSLLETFKPHVVQDKDA